MKFRYHPSKIEGHAGTGRGLFYTAMLICISIMHQITPRLVLYHNVLICINYSPGQIGTRFDKDTRKTFAVYFIQNTGPSLFNKGPQTNYNKKQPPFSRFKHETLLSPFYIVRLPE